MFSFSDWFPFELSWDTGLQLLFTVAMTLVGTIAGMIFVILEAYRPPVNGNSSRLRIFTDENRLYTFLAIMLGIVFWALKLGFVDGVIYGFFLRVSIGTVMNVVFRKRLAQTGVSLIEAAAKKANADLEAHAQQLEPKRTPATSATSMDTYPPPPKR